MRPHIAAQTGIGEADIGAENPLFKPCRLAAARQILRRKTRFISRADWQLCVGYYRGKPALIDEHIKVYCKMKREQLVKIDLRMQEILEEISRPEARLDTVRFTALMKEQSDLTPVVETYRALLAAEQDERDSRDLLDGETDGEMLAMLREEWQDARSRIASLEDRIERLLLPKDPNDGRNVIVEIRGGAGGDEAALFAADLFRMYAKYALRNGWKEEMISLSENGLGGFKECIFQMSGPDVWSKMKFESGTHRVQRVPETESGGRIHTSTATVAIMPEAEEADVEVDPKDCRFDVFRASGNGGQCVNTTDSAVRLTHIPTGIVISCQDEKSQIKNKAKALKVLRTRLYDLERRRLQEERAGLRKSQVGTGDRSEKIRTYNFPQGRVTDHRIHLTVHRIESVMDGDLDEIIGALTADDEARRLTGEGS